MENAAAFGMVIYLIGCLLFILLCILIFIAPWRCWVHLKGLRRDLEETGFQRRKDMQVVLNALGAINATLVSIDGKLTPEKPSSNQITCPYCGKRLEAPSGIVKGQHLVCPFCHEKFSY